MAMDVSINVLERLAGKVPLNVPGATMAAISQRAT